MQGTESSARREDYTQALYQYDIADGRKAAQQRRDDRDYFKGNGEGDQTVTSRARFEATSVVRQFNAYKLEQRQAEKTLK
ncbi:hypothetical protein ACUSIJ_02375 [Pseudochelatococcus sp. B33]